MCMCSTATPPLETNTFSLLTSNLCLHTFIPLYTYLHTFIPPYTYLHTFIHIPPYLNTFIHIPPYLHTHTHTSIPSYTYTYFHTHTSIPPIPPYTYTYTYQTDQHRPPTVRPNTSQKRMGFLRKPRYRRPKVHKRFRIRHAPVPTRHGNGCT
jgi:hypothetical protein